MNAKADISSLTLRIIAMVCMICDHLWATVIPGNEWLTWVGRIAFPIFAFLIAEGYHNTNDIAKYIRRMIIWALISEIPFNLIYGGFWIYPFQQNVLWTYVLSLLCLKSLDKIRSNPNMVSMIILSFLTVCFYYILGTLLMVDYSGYGILMVLVFHLFRGNSRLVRMTQFAVLFYINWFMMKGLAVPVMMFEHSFMIQRQGFAVLALIPIWMYHGKQGNYSKSVRFICYAFYPVHMFILGFMLQIM